MILPPFRFSAGSSASWLSVSPKWPTGSWQRPRTTSATSSPASSMVWNGLALSSRRDIYERILESELDSARSLAGIAHHLAYSDVKTLDFAARLLKRAIDKGDPVAVVDCLLFALEHYGTEKIA